MKIGTLMFACGSIWEWDWLSDTEGGT
jgi:hypothetical protein